MVRLSTLGLVSQVVLQGSRDSPLRLLPTNEPGIPHRQHDDTVCPAQTDHFTGSLPLSHGKELFYWFFSSSNDPVNDPIVVWLSGGPGAASSFAAVTEIGPCLVNTTDNSTYHNPYHWAQFSNLLILDQPAGAGFSRASPDPEHRVKTLEQATDDFVDFMHKFTTEVVPHLSGNQLHIAAESYGGRWAPAFMHRLTQLTSMSSRYAIPNPLGSLILVNAVVGTLGGDLASANYEFGCTEDGMAVKLGLRFDLSVCSHIQQVGPTCEFYGNLCESTNSIDVCKDASNFCASEIEAIVPLQSRNMYNVAEPCLNPEQLCIPSWTAATEFLNSAEIRKAFGLRNQIWTPISTDIATSFMETGAVHQSVIPNLIDLLNSGTRVLVLNGNLDSLVVTPGQIRIMDKLPWKGQLEYRQQKWANWVIEDDDVNGESRGQVKNSTGLTFVSFDRAGHMVPSDDPRGTFQFVNQWLKG